VSISLNLLILLGFMAYLGAAMTLPGLAVGSHLRRDDRAQRFGSGEPAEVFVRPRETRRRIVAGQGPADFLSQSGSQIAVLFARQPVGGPRHRLRIATEPW
jgi:hypothetical protein